MLKEDIKYQDVTEGFEKDRGYEKFIENFNNHLASFEKDQYRKLPEILPSVHVIGVLRSGTTLLTQMICSHLNIGYINNLIARFWKAPVAGIRLSRELLGDNYASNLSSNYGKTDKIYELNEFNYFWYDLLGYNSHHQKTDSQAKNIDWQHLVRVMKNMLWAYEKPIVFKSFMLGWHAQQMQNKLSKTCFIWIKRDPVDTALSLLDFRRDLFGTIERWASFKPLTYEQLREKSPVEQVAGQVYYLEKSYKKQIEALPKSNYLVLEYEDVCKNPRKVLTSIQSLINENGGEVDIIGEDIMPQKPSKKAAENYPEYDSIRQALKALYA